MRISDWSSDVCSSDLPFICERFASSGVDPHRITFEITETAAIANISSTQAMVSQLRALGCQFALEDFGAGFASYSYLKQLPVDVLKIDGAFIRNLAKEIGRASGRESVGQYVSISVDPLSYKKNVPQEYVTK